MIALAKQPPPPSKLTQILSVAFVVTLYLEPVATLAFFGAFCTCTYLEAQRYHLKNSWKIEYARLRWRIEHEFSPQQAADLYGFSLTNPIPPGGIPWRDLPPCYTATIEQSQDKAMVSLKEDIKPNKPASNYGRRMAAPEDIEEEEKEEVNSITRRYAASKETTTEIPLEYGRRFAAPEDKEQEVNGCEVAGTLATEPIQQIHELPSKPTRHIIPTNQYERLAYSHPKLFTWQPKAPRRYANLGPTRRIAGD